MLYALYEIEINMRCIVYNMLIKEKESQWRLFLIYPFFFVIKLFYLSWSLDLKKEWYLCRLLEISNMGCLWFICKGRGIYKGRGILYTEKKNVRTNVDRSAIRRGFYCGSNTFNMDTRTILLLAYIFAGKVNVCNTKARAFKYMLA